MKKIPSLFVRDYEKIVSFGGWHEITLPPGDNRFTGVYSETRKGRFLATEQVTPCCEWVIAGKGIATRKWDGTAVLFMDGQWFKRYDAKHGKTPPPGFFEAQPEPDPITAHWPGWVPVNQNDPADKYIHEAIYTYTTTWTDYRSGDTFEAIGPKINGNKEQYMHHTLKRHGEEQYPGINYMFNNTKDASYVLARMRIEGIVFHHPDGRMCKVKRSDFGLPW